MLTAEMNTQGHEPIRILIVDDEPDLVEILRLSLEDAGFEVSSATCRQEAIREIEKNPPHVIVSDVRMPDGGGMALLTEAKHKLRSLPLFYFSTGFADISVHEAKRLGVHEILLKPYDPDDLVKSIRAFYERNPILK